MHGSSLRSERFLSEGLSLAEIGRRYGSHEATVSYWVKKHGLRPSIAKGARRGEDLRDRAGAAGGGRHVDCTDCRGGWAQQGDRAALARQARTPYDRHRMGARPRAGAREARDAGLSTATLRCPRHGASSQCASRAGTTAAGSVARRRSCDVAARSRRLLSTRPVDAVGFAATTGAWRHWSSTISTGAARSSDLRGEELIASSACAPRFASAFCCALIATRRWRAA